MFRGGIEPPTQGFSVLCSTTELPKHKTKYYIKNIIFNYDNKSKL
jgi:hypothetical protein